MFTLCFQSFYTSEDVMACQHVAETYDDIITKFHFHQSAFCFDLFNAEKQNLENDVTASFHFFLFLFPAPSLHAIDGTKVKSCSYGR